MFARHLARKFRSVFGRLVLAFGIALTALNAAAAATAPFSILGTGSAAIGVVLPDTNDPRWSQDGLLLGNAISAAGYAPQVLYSQNNPAIEKTNVETLIAQGVKALIICPVNKTSAAAAVEEARAAGVKVIAYDRLILNTPALDYYVTFDVRSVGRAQAQYLVDHAAGTARPVYLYAGGTFDNNTFLFFEGNWQVLQPKFVDGTLAVKNSSAAVALQNHATLTQAEMNIIIGQITTQWDYNTAGSLAQANLAAVTAADKGDVFILAPNDSTARAIGDVFAADAEVSSYMLTGQDAEQASVQYIIDGRQSMTVFKDNRSLAESAAAAAVTFVNGGTPSADTTFYNGAIDVPAKVFAVVTVDSNNLRSVLIDSGYHQLSDFLWPVVSITIPTSGGGLMSAFDSTAYTFPAGAFSNSVVVSHTMTTDLTAAPGLASIGHAFGVTAAYSGSGGPAQPVKAYGISIGYNDLQVGLVEESTLALYYWDGASWVKEPTSAVDLVAKAVTATPSHLSAWSVMGEIHRVFLPIARR